MFFDVLNLKTRAAGLNFFSACFFVLSLRNINHCLLFQQRCGQPLGSGGCAGFYHYHSYHVVLFTCFVVQRAVWAVRGFSLRFVSLVVR